MLFMYYTALLLCFHEFRAFNMIRIFHFAVPLLVGCSSEIFNVPNLDLCVLVSLLDCIKGGVMKRFRHAGKKAVKFRFSATIEKLIVEGTKAW